MNELAMAHGLQFDNMNTLKAYIETLVQKEGRDPIIFEHVLTEITWQELINPAYEWDKYPNIPN